MALPTLLNLRPFNAFPTHSTTTAYDRYYASPDQAFPKCYLEEISQRRMSLFD